MSTLSTTEKKLAGLIGRTSREAWLLLQTLRDHPNFSTLLAYLETKGGTVLDADVEQAAQRFLSEPETCAHMDAVGRGNSAGTLGDVLYADKAKALVLEKDWVRLIKSIVESDLRALHELYERTHRIVLALAARITNERETAEAVTLGAFYDVWRRASTYDPASGSVVGWIMNQARSRAIDRLPLLAETRAKLLLPAPQPWAEPEWEEVAPSIRCKLLATDTELHRVSMLVRLAPGGDYPPHRHAGVEELHLLDGELWIDDRKLYPGDYNRAEPGTADSRVWSETGCMCVLVTSTRDELR